MSRRFVSTGVALVCGGCLVLGCASRPKAGPVSDTPTADRADQIRASYKTTFPAAKVGLVTAVLEGEPYALIGDVDTSASRTGDVFSFLDADETVIASGTVVKVEQGDLTVRVMPGRRGPRVGDVAVKF